MIRNEPSITDLERLSDFYMMDLYDIMDDKFENVVIPEKPLHGLHHTEVSEKDFKGIAQFGRIIKNYQKLKRLADEI